MTRLRLPESLPYDYIDEYLDDKFEFEVDEYIDHEGNSVRHYSANLRSQLYRGNFSRLMFSLHSTGFEDTEEDELGYAHIEHDLGGMKWRAKPLTDKELEYLLDNLE